MPNIIHLIAGSRNINLTPPKRSKQKCLNVHRVANNSIMLETTRSAHTFAGGGGGGGKH